MINELAKELEAKCLAGLQARELRTADAKRIIMTPLSEEKRAAFIKKVLSMSEQARKKRMGARQRGGSKPRCNLSELPNHYSRLHPIWKDAKTIFRQNKARSSWREIVKAAYPQLDDDLVKRLSKRGDSLPSDVALEDAARHCGANRYEYSLPHLKEVLRSKKT